MTEYNPKPPFDTGHPDTAGPEMVNSVRQMMGNESILAGMEIAKNKRGTNAGV